MTDLSPEARKLLGAARDADDPGDADRDRVRARVLAAIGAGTATTAGGAAHAAPSAGVGVGLAKLALLLLVVAGVATGAYFALRDDAKPTTPTPAIAEAEPVAEPVAAAEPEPEPVPEPEPEPVLEIEAEPAPVKPRTTRKPRPEPAASPEVVRPTTPADSLRAERALLAKATAALRAGDPDAALAALGEHQHRYPHGILEEERAASTVLALCATGRVAEGKKARARFVDAWPRSVHAARVGAACE